MNIFCRVNVVVDAQRGEFYLAAWEDSAASCVAIAPLKIVPAADIDALRGAGENLVGQDVDKILFPAAVMVAQLATVRTDFIAGESLVPIYLRETNFVKAPLARQ